MRKLFFYQQKRQDGGFRTAVGTEHATLLHHFEPGEEPSDPALLWYVDVRCEGPRLPTDPEKALQWLRNHGTAIRNGLTLLGEKLAAGMDFDELPLRWEVPDPPRGVRMTIVCTAIRRVALLEMASILRDIRDHWEEILEQLETAPAAP